MGEKRTYNFKLLVQIITTPFPTLSYAARHILGLLQLLHEKREKKSHSFQVQRNMIRYLKN
jgi:hypothetical protein